MDLPYAQGSVPIAVSLVSKQTNSYSQVLSSSSIMGSAAGIKVLLGMVRVKFAAIFIGASGVGLIASFSALQGLIGALAGLGLQSSAVRQIAAAMGKDDEQAMGRTVHALRRICWLTGLLGMAGMMLLSPILSQLTFGHREYTLDIAALGVVILLGNITGGQMALIQGMRRIGDIARANVFGAMVGTAAALGFYASLGFRGIIPTLLTVAATQLALSFHFARRVTTPKVSLTWQQTFAEANGMVKLGLVMMWNGLLLSAVGYATVTLIAQRDGVQAVGLYSAAFALSGVLVNFVLGAMGADYYPRIASVAADKPTMVRMVNEQTEIGLLLALPFLVATMALAPWILVIFYTPEFLGAAKLMQWFILGCLGRVIAWPLGYVMLAMNKGQWFLISETSFNLLHIGLVTLGLLLYGIEGVAIAFCVMYGGYVLAVRLICGKLADFKWSVESKRRAVLSLAVLVATFMAARLAPLWPATLFGTAFTLISSVLCIRGLVAKVGVEHRITRAITRLPGAKLLLSPH